MLGMRGFARECRQKAVAHLVTQALTYFVFNLYFYIDSFLYLCLYLYLYLLSYLPESVLTLERDGAHRDKIMR